VNGRGTFDLPLTKRMTTLRDEISIPLRSRYPETEEAQLPFVIIGKDYVPMDKLVPGLLSRVKNYIEPQTGMRFIYKNGKRYNENKGLVFVSENGRYDPSTRFEWLWPELFPVVFQVTVKDPSHFLLSLHVPNTGELIDYKIDNFDQDYVRLLQDLNGATEGNIACVHVEGQFRYSYLTKQSVSSVLDVIKYMEEVTTSVSRVELELTAQRARPNSNSTSPTQLPRSPLIMACSPDAEVVTESPIGRTCGAPMKRAASDSEEQPDPKRKRIAYGDLQ